MDLAKVSQSRWFLGAILAVGAGSLGTIVFFDDWLFPPTASPLIPRAPSAASASAWSPLPIGSEQPPQDDLRALLETYVSRPTPAARDVARGDPVGATLGALGLASTRLRSIELQTIADGALLGAASVLYDDSDEEGGNCFLAGTQVSMADGKKKRIEEVKDGEWVKAMDPARGVVEARQVMRTFRNETREVVEVRVAFEAPVEAMGRQRGRSERQATGVARGGEGEDGEPPLDAAAGKGAVVAGERVVRCTAEHPWRVKGRGWVHAGDLREGDELPTEDGARAMVCGVVVREERAATYNFEVEGVHTYFVGGGVGQGGVLVHNTSVGKRVRAKSKSPTSPTVSRRTQGTRYIGPEEAVVVAATGRVPNVDRHGLPKTVFYTHDHPTNSATEAQQRYALPNKPTHRVTVDTRRSNARRVHLTWRLNVRIS